MAKIILNTNLANATYLVEYKSIDVGVGKKIEIKSTELTITPNHGRVIDAKDFSYGLLPSVINKIEFYNKSNPLNLFCRFIIVLYNFFYKI